MECELEPRMSLIRDRLKERISNDDKYIKLSDLKTVGEQMFNFLTIISRRGRIQSKI